MKQEENKHAFLQHPANLTALTYLFLNFVFWFGVGGGSVMAGLFGSVFTGSISALLILAMARTRESNRPPMRGLLIWCAALLFLLFPVNIAIAAQLHTDAQAALAVIFVGGLASAVHLVLSLILLAAGRSRMGR